LAVNSSEAKTAVVECISGEEQIAHVTALANSLMKWNIDEYLRWPLPQPRATWP